MYRNIADDEFMENVATDIKYFVKDATLGLGSSSSKSVLLFPPVNNYRRFLIHKTCDEATDADLHHFSIGQGDDRRTIVCFTKDLIRVPAEAAMGIDQYCLPSMPPVRHEEDKKWKVMAAIDIYRPPAARRLNAQKARAANPEPEKPKSKPRRPDIQVYVPRPKRLSASGSDTTSSAMPSPVSRKPSTAVITTSKQSNEHLPDWGPSPLRNDTIKLASTTNDISESKSKSVDDDHIEVEPCHNIVVNRKTINEVPKCLIQPVSNPVSETIGSERDIDSSFHKFPPDSSSIVTSSEQVVEDLCSYDVVSEDKSSNTNDKASLCFKPNQLDVGIKADDMELMVDSDTSNSEYQCRPLIDDESNDTMCGIDANDVQLVELDGNSNNSKYQCRSSNDEKPNETTYIADDVELVEQDYDTAISEYQYRPLIDDKSNDTTCGINADYMELVEHGSDTGNTEYECRSLIDDMSNDTTCGINADDMELVEHGSDTGNSECQCRPLIDDKSNDTMCGINADDMKLVEHGSDTGNSEYQCRPLIDDKSTDTMCGINADDVELVELDSDTGNSRYQCTPLSDEKPSDTTYDAEILVSNNRKKCEDISRNHQEQNRKNRLILHGKVMSDVLVISDPEPVQDVTPLNSESPPKTLVVSKKKICKPKEIAPTVPMNEEEEPNLDISKLNPDECTWDMMFDENGDCLHPHLMEELTSKVGKVAIKTPRSDYKAFVTRAEFQPHDEYSHVLEIYNFSPEFKTQDLVNIFSPYKDKGFEIKWVDDTHALGVFSSSIVAADVLSTDHPFVKTRPLHEATAESRVKARRSSEFLRPYRARPETCPALARRLVTGALGVRLKTAKQEREAEKVLLNQAREKKRLEARQKEDAWEGNL